MKGEGFSAQEYLMRLADGSLGDAQIPASDE
jgi:hypothetical protein